MSYCPKCGSKVNEEMTFCPKCGAPLKVEQVPAEKKTTYRRDEKGEKAEKAEKGEKGEKREKREYGFIGPLIGGLILLFLGLTFYLEMVNIAERRILWAFFFVIIGVVIIAAAIYGALLATRRHPRT